MNIETLQFPDNFPAPELYLVELGRITALWGSLESSVNQALLKLSGIDEASAWRLLTISVHSNFKQKVDSIETLCHSMVEEYEHLKEYKKSINAIRKAQSKRNHYLHNGMYLDEDTGLVMTHSMQARGKLKSSVEQVKLNDLKEISCLIHSALLLLHELITTVHNPPFWERDDC